MNQQDIMNSFTEALNDGEEYALKMFAQMEFTETCRNLGRLKSFVIDRYKKRSIEVVRDNGKVVICRIMFRQPNPRVSKNFKTIAAAKRAIDDWCKDYTPYWYK